MTHKGKTTEEGRKVSMAATKKIIELLETLHMEKRDTQGTGDRRWSKMCTQEHKQELGWTRGTDGE